MDIADIMGKVASAAKLIREIKSNIDQAKAVLAPKDLESATAAFNEIIDEAKAVGMQLDAALAEAEKRN